MLCVNVEPELIIILVNGRYINNFTEGPYESINLTYRLEDSYGVFNLFRAPGATTVEQSHVRFDMPTASFSNPPASGAAYWNASNKKWEIKDIASGSDTFYFEISDNNGNLISSKTFTEIKSAIESNKHILVLLYRVLYQATGYCMSTNSNAKLVLDGGNGWGELNISSDNTITLQTGSIPTYKAGNGISISNDGTISVTAAKIYSGTSNAPSADLGENGDIYIQTEG